MKARPILFNTDMVKAILAGQKTQTRREVKPQPEAKPDWHGGFVLKSKRINVSLGAFNERGGRMLPRDPSPCPFGQPGDLLYVRETHAPAADCWGAWERRMEQDRKGPDPEIFFAADHEERPFIEKWRPSIHMPRWASRLTLEITDVRVERLQEISEEDAKAEGFLPPDLPPEVRGIRGDFRAGATTSFAITWSRIYNNWNDNPWVWVVEFKVHHCNVDALLRERGAA